MTAWLSSYGSLQMDVRTDIVNTMRRRLVRALHPPVLGPKRHRKFAGSASVDGRSDDLLIPEAIGATCRSWLTQERGNA
jgi:hypothetical protein